MGLHLMDCETLHNWRNRRFFELPYFRDLPAEVMQDILRAHDDHHQGRSGMGTADEVRRLVASWPEHLECARYL